MSKQVHHKQVALVFKCTTLASFGHCP